MTRRRRRCSGKLQRDKKPCQGACGTATLAHATVEAPRLCRASHILQQADQSELTTSQLKDYRDLLDDVQGAHASGA